MKQAQFLKFIVILLIFQGSIFFQSCTSESEKAEQELQILIDSFIQKYKPVKEKHSLAFFSALNSGDAAEYKNAAEFQVILSKMLSDKNLFEKIKTIRESAKIQDSLFIKQADVLYNMLLPYQSDENEITEIAMLESEINKKFSTFRAVVDGKQITDNEIDDYLKNSQDSKLSEKYWSASKEVGTLVVQDILKLVKMRNKIAVTAGFKNYYEMQMKISGLEPEKVDEIYEELDFSTRGPYTQLKSEIDNFLSLLLNKPANELQAWDYQDRFFQNAPEIYNTNFDKFYKDVDIVSISKQTFSGLGMSMDDVLQKSELKSGEKKQQTPFTIDIDKQGDIRISASLEGSEKSMNALLYETGFAATYKYLDKNLPYLLKEPSHFIISDAVAQLMAQLSYDINWISVNFKVSDAEMTKIKQVNKKNQSLSKFVFSRWALVMYNFEKNMYADPDQDLNALWWNLVERYQMIKKPADRDLPDWASKSHIVNQPCTYHNYMLGELAGAQIKDYILRQFGGGKNEFDKSCFTNTKIGEYLKKYIIAPGKSKSWTDIIKYATSSELSPDFFTKEYIETE